MGEAMTGRAIIVTGSTGAGKTTTCTKLVEELDGLWLHFGIDLFLGKVVPRKFVDGGPCSNQGVHMVPVSADDPEGPWRMDMGLYGMEMVRCFHRMAEAAIRGGQNLVIDHIATIDPPLLQDCVSALGDLPVWFVALKPPTEVIPRRIDERLEAIVATLGREHAVRNSENKKRVARYLYDGIFANDVFDQVIDSDRLSPDQVVAAIIAEMGEGRAFHELARRLDAGLSPFGA